MPSIGALIIRIGFWGILVYYAILIIRNPHNSIGTYLGPYSTHQQLVRIHAVCAVQSGEVLAALRSIASHVSTNAHIKPCVNTCSEARLQTDLCDAHAHVSSHLCSRSIQLYTSITVHTGTESYRQLVPICTSKAVFEIFQ